MKNPVDCPCGSAQPFQRCCGLLLQGMAAGTAEQLMRSRYTAYALNDPAYLQRTWHPSTRPAGLQLDDEPRPYWQKLFILATTGGATGDREGHVEFLALYEMNGRVLQLHESSSFVREENLWYYLDGTAGAGIGRSVPCPCRSGRKFKRCCAISHGADRL